MARLAEATEVQRELVHATSRQRVKPQRRSAASDAGPHTPSTTSGAAPARQRPWLATDCDHARRIEPGEPLTATIEDGQPSSDIHANQDGHRVVFEWLASGKFDVRYWGGLLDGLTTMMGSSTAGNAVLATTAAGTVSTIR